MATSTRRSPNNQNNVLHVGLNLGTFLTRHLQNNTSNKQVLARYFGEREPQWLNFHIFLWNGTPSLHI